VEFIEGHAGVGEVLPDSLDEGLGHVQGEVSSRTRLGQSWIPETTMSSSPWRTVRG
jgi:hypothetical protein